MPWETDKKDIADRMETFIANLPKGKGEMMDSYEVCKRTIDILRRLISQTKWMNAQELLQIIRTEGKKLIAADRTESSIANMVRRVLKIIREEFVSANKDSAEMDVPLDDSAAADIDYTQSCPNLKGKVIEGINELLQEIEGCVDNIANQALEHIHADETIMTFGRSRTVEAFLKKAAKKRKFHVICAEGEPLMKGHLLAKNLAEVGIQVTLIPDTHMFAMMARVNKVIIGTHTIFAEGGLKAPCGMYNIALAAKEHKVPVFVCAGTYKLSTENFCHEEQEGFQRYADPNTILPLEELVDGLEDVEIGNFVFEYVSPDMIEYFIFNIGTHVPAYTYRLLKDYYHKDDKDL